MTLKKFGGNKGWLVGDVKGNASKAVSDVINGESQWLAMKNFAKNYQYISSAFYASLFTVPRAEIVRAEREALEQGVILRIITFTNIRRDQLS